ncbi:flagellar motor switch protein FliM [Geotalea uraniireducens]|uniref:Flagellar motor switch protein FliM n=1 Tax=Geotalea uraniireducens TaxID=351604 RepID=A0ABM8EGB3_9BACT|nr:flagellar motor switch protein FliM [Geotalea uraniireducens]BDV41459.1 flagellar motor switch protein FliM [Geotalea uraniireducens]
MERILTKQEIESLLAAVFDGRIEPDKELAKEQGVVHTYDLFNSESHKGLVPNLDIIYDSFIRYQRGTLSNRLGRIIEIKKVGAGSYKFDDFIQTLPSPVCMAIYKADPLKGAALIAIDSPLVFTIVDCILGGTGNSAVPSTNRMFTSIEVSLVSKVVKDALADLEKAWAPLYPAKMSLLRMEMNPRLVNIVPPEYQVVTMDLEIHIDDIVGRMIFAVPYMTIEPIRDKLKSGTQFDLMAIDPQWSYRLSTELLEAPLDLAVEVGSAVISMNDLLNLTVGDTIMLGTPCHSDLVVKVSGVPKFTGAPGLRHGNKALQITNIIDKGGKQ